MGFVFYYTSVIIILIRLFRLLDESTAFNFISLTAIIIIKYFGLSDLIYQLLNVDLLRMMMMIMELLLRWWCSMYVVVFCQWWEVRLIIMIATIVICILRYYRITNRVDVLVRCCCYLLTTLWHILTLMPFIDKSFAQNECRRMLMIVDFRNGFTSWKLLTPLTTGKHQWLYVWVIFCCCSRLDQQLLITARCLNVFLMVLGLCFD